MIKKILDWILGKNDSASTKHPLDGATRAAEEKAAPYKIEAPVVEPAPVVAETPAAEPVVAEVAPVTVKAKFKKAELNKKTKKELLDLAATHGVVVKARASKEELVKTLAKI
jgi:NAD(P)-dependent dehydrogenase (short-subunit alcohol dehydrogenase family)